jgi:starch synthase
MRILSIAAEAAPYVKVGGLADVAGALPTALAERGMTVEILLPGYRSIDRKKWGFETVGSIALDYAGKRVDVELQRTKRADGVTVTLVHDAPAFDRPGVYDDPHTKEGYRDNPERFAYFARVAAELALIDTPDIVHVHDAHGALVPALLKTVLKPRVRRRVGHVLTIHNLAHPMRAPSKVLFDAGFPQEAFFPLSPLEFHGGANFLKTGILYADAITTVSPRYALEIQTEQFGNGLDGLLRDRKSVLIGILNGIDTKEWDPETDKHLPATYSVKNVAGKKKCRDALLSDFNLAAGPDTPVFGIVSRFAKQKGLDLIENIAWELSKLDLRLVVLGSGQKEYERLFQELQRARPDQFAVFIGFHEPLAHRIEAGADFFVMPSLFEPCGLNQMYSLRYGTLPIVRRTGGLADTVQDVEKEPERGNGLSFDAPDPRALLAKIRAACALFKDKDRLKKIQKRGMSTDFSWTTAAGRYVSVYEKVIA